MRAPTACELLDLWERGRAGGPVERGLALLAAACPDASPDALADFTVGARDAALVALREATFGPHMTGLIHCPHCGERIEAAFATYDLRAEPPAQPAAPLTLNHGGYELTLRQLTSRDLAAAQHGDADTRRRSLIACCVVAASHAGHPTPAGELPADVAYAAAARLAEADPGADLNLAIACPACAHHWHAVFDIVAFFWSEIEAWAARVLREVHVLASAYGWSERDILSLSAARRRHYLDMVGAWATS
jgi:hypothetical protein